MTDFNYKLEKKLFTKIVNIKDIMILELGVQKGRSTIEFLKICNKNNGKLFSVDVDDCSQVSNDPNWTFIKSRDDDFEFIKNLIPKKIDVLFIDTLHEAEHVRKILYNYYELVKKDGYIFIDDISHLPYVKNSIRENFYCEVNNKETFQKILEIYMNNEENFDLEFSFISSGLSIIKKKTNAKLVPEQKIFSKENTIKNIFRKLWKKVKGI